MSSLRFVRIAPGPMINAYMRKRFPSTARAFECDHLLYHSWLPGVVPLAEHEVAAAADLLRGSIPSPDANALLQRMTDAGWDRPGAIDFDRLVGNIGRFPAQQTPLELREFIIDVAARRPRVIVEIGTAAGGMLYCLSQVAAEDALIISIDVGEGGEFGGGQSDSECDLFRTFGFATQEFHFIRWSSFAYSSIQKLQEILAGRKIDLLFIDGNHNYGAVKSDFDMYKPFVSASGLIALHDIRMYPHTHGIGADVGIFWNELKSKYQTREIVDPAASPSYEEREARLAEHPFLDALVRKFTGDELFAVITRSEFVSESTADLADLRRSLPPSLFGIPPGVQVAMGIGVVSNA